MSTEHKTDSTLLVDRFRMAYAEAGYPRAVVAINRQGNVETAPWSIDNDEWACWRAGSLVYGPADSPCFDCWKDKHSRNHGRGLACRQGSCTAAHNGSSSSSPVSGGTS